MAKAKTKTNCFEPFSIAPLSGILDARSDPGLINPASFRFRQNWESPAANSACRATGWRRLLDGNGDAHDQLLTLSPGAVSEPLNFLFEARTRPGQSRLYIGTNHRLLALNASTRNFQIISDELGAGLPFDCTGPGWSTGLVGRTAVFSNGVDARSHVIGQPNNEANDQAVRTIADLETLGVSSAQFVIAWRGLVFLFNVTQDGAHVDHRVWWSDFNRPLSFVPKTGSAAGQQDLGQGETILNALPLGNSLIIYTATGIWIADIIGLPNTISFTKRYSHPKGKACLAYRRALASSGTAHFYLSRDNICRFDLYSPEPDTPEWLDAAAPVIFENISSTNCNAPCAGFDSSSTLPQSQMQSGTLWFSWNRMGELCPTQSLRIQTDQRFASLVDHGFTAFGNFTADQPLTMREWLLNNCICTPAGLADAGWGFVKEGEPCAGLTVPTCTSYPARLYTTQTKNLDGREIEDMDAASASADSLCALLAGRGPADFCAEDFAGSACSASQLFLGASAQDKCIKQMGEVYYRDRCVSTAGCGTYVRDGYSSILRSGGISFGSPFSPKQINKFLTDLLPAEQTIPSKIRLRIGTSFQPVDPNKVGCNVIWIEATPKDMKCLTGTEAQQIMKKTRQGAGFQWELYREGHWLYYELRIDGTGGSACMSRVELSVALMKKC